MEQAAIPTEGVAGPPRTPVLVITGFLGSGKTTLLNHLLGQRRDERIAVLENEFGAISIDTDLIIRSDEDIVEIKNGCLCCTVRRDLINILTRLAEEGHPYDRIVIETTGLANPSPVAQTFMAVPTLYEHYDLQGILTVVDAKHVASDLERHPVVQEQIAFANLLVLNKADTVSPDELVALERRLRQLNDDTAIVAVTRGQLDAAVAFGLAPFDPDHGLRADPTFTLPDYPFKWVGVYDLPRGDYDARWHASGTPHADELFLIRPIATADDAGIDALLPAAVQQFFARERAFKPGETIGVGTRVWGTALAENRVAFQVGIKRAGRYAIFAQHPPTSFDLCVGAVAPQPLHTRAWESRYGEDAAITSVALSAPGSLDMKRLNRFFRESLFTDGQEILRMKGVLSLAGEERKFIFHMVNTMTERGYGAPWQDDLRYSHLIVIGRGLDRDSLTRQFMRCCAPERARAVQAVAHA